MIKATQWCIKIKAKNLSEDKNSKIGNYVESFDDLKYRYFNDMVIVYGVDSITIANIMENKILDIIEGEV